MNFIKYALWVLSSSLAFTGVWLFDFTEPDATVPHKRRLTSIGKIALPFTLLGFVLALTLEIKEDQAKATAADAAEANQADLRRQLEGAKMALAHPLSPVRVICDINYKNIVQHFPQYGKRVEALLARRRSSVGDSRRLQDQVIFPLENEDAASLRLASTTVTLGNRRGDVTFEVQSPEYGREYSEDPWRDTGWNAPQIMLMFARERSSLSLTRRIWAPATVWKNDEQVTSLRDIIGVQHTIRVDAEVFHQGVPPQDVDITTIHIALPRREHLIVLDPKLCTRDDKIGDRIRLTCLNVKVQG